MNKNIRINSISDLHREKEILRNKISHQEEILRDHYNNISEDLGPVFRIIRFISGNRIFRGSKENKSKSDWMSILLEILAAGAAGGFVFGKSKKNAFKSIFAYGLDQAAEYIQKKDISEHIENFREWFGKFRKDKETESTDDEVGGE